MKDVTEKVEENELSGLEAEQPYELGKMIAKEGTTVNIGDATYTLMLPLVNDYGKVSIMPIDNDQPLLMHYESSTSKAKRIKTEINVLLSCTKRKLKYTYRIIMAGYHDSLKIHYLITKCYGLSISDLQSNQPVEKFTKPTCLKLGLETIKCVEQLHETGFIHRDIKPEVFVTSQAAPYRIYIVHFGLARRFRAKNRTHVPRRTSLPLIGDLKYISRSAHKRYDRSQRDDIESWWYMFIGMFDRDLLTWIQKADQDGIQSDKELFMTEKGFQTVTKTCPDIPQTFYKIICHINSLDFTTQPNFHKIKKILKGEIEVNNFKHEPYDWIKTEIKTGRAPTMDSNSLSSSEDIKSDKRECKGSRSSIDSE